MGVKGKAEKKENPYILYWVTMLQITKKNILIVDLEKRRQGLSLWN